MTIVNAQTDIESALAELKSATVGLILVAATNGSDISAFLGSMYQSIETEVANIQTITATVVQQVTTIAPASAQPKAG
jgi:Tfp pilus assembly pilus retraction ATPase PilT